jgi:predicted nucleotidyltransferase
MAHILDIGSALVAARRAAGISQRELGERVGSVQQQIARWEATGYRTASLEHVDAVARALGYERLPGSLPLAAEAQAAYTTPSELAPGATPPVRDLGEIAARIRAHAREIQERYGIVRIGVIGSFAAGEQTDSSDVDLLVEMPKPGGFLFIEAADYMEQILGRKVDFLEPSALNERLRPRILRGAIYVWAA